MTRPRVVFLSGSRWSSLGGEIAAGLDPERWEMHAVCERVTMSRVRGLTPRRVLRKLWEIASSRVARLLGRGADGPPALCDVPHVTLHEVAKIGDAESIDILRSLAPRASVNTGGCGILRQELLDVGGPVLNVHCGLPHTRGFNAVEWTAWHGRPFVMSIHRIDAGVDTGPILLQRELEDPQGLDSSALRRAFDDDFGALFVDALERLRTGGDDAFTPQDESAGRTHYAMHDELRSVLDDALTRRTARS